MNTMLVVSSTPSSSSSQPPWPSLQPQHRRQRSTRSLSKCFILLVSLFMGIRNIGWSSKFIRHLQQQEQQLKNDLLQPHQKLTTTRSSNKPNNNNIAVFYNLYISNESDVGRVARSIVDEQFQFFQPYHYPIYIHSIGHPLPQLFSSSSSSSSNNNSTESMSKTENINMKHMITMMPNVDVSKTVSLGHHDTGSELVSLQSLWEYCQNTSSPTTTKVVYLHSKGSYTSTESNELLRRFITKGATSDACASISHDHDHHHHRSNGDDDSIAVTTKCNVCSSRFSPLPHPHTSGNMWLARCDYVQKLIEPKKFEDRMEEMGLRGYPPCDGRQRYSLEHWIHSHPMVRPCDLYDNPSFTWNYDGIPTNVDEFDISSIGVLKSAPRFDLNVYEKTMCKYDKDGHLTGTLLDRLQEYEILYEEQPSPDWWGWKLWTNLSMVVVA
mmetsp:Transcript_16220/g.39836  ORF Transcript_16220/g.39836 Transcript_16220/m.39836 type:complete len:439 (-) Transcript_16220:393-1709(-)